MRFKVSDDYIRDLTETCHRPGRSPDELTKDLRGSTTPECDSVLRLSSEGGSRTIPAGSQHLT